jgi:5'-3' exonuclease
MTAPEYDYLLVDGDLLLHRALHVEENAALARSDGTLTGGVFTSLRAIAGTLEVFRARRCIVVYDGGRSERRLKLYPDYKGQRATRDDDDPEKRAHLERFVAQKELLLGGLRHFGVASIRLWGREGDDVIAKIVRHVKKPTVVMTEDRDFFQLVSDRVAIWRASREALVTLEDFAELTGWPSPRLHLLWKAVEGDHSDNIDGVRGVGEKTFQQVIAEAAVQGPEDAERICAWAASHKKALVRRLADGLPTIKRNLALVDLSLEEWTEDEVKAMRGVVQTPMRFSNRDAYGWCAQMEFQSMLDSFAQFVQPFRRLGG